MAPEEGRNICNKLITIRLAVIFMIKILASSQLYRLPKFIGSHYGSVPKKQLCKLEELKKKEVRHNLAIWFLEKCSLYNLHCKFLKFRLYKPNLTNSKLAYTFCQTLLFKKINSHRYSLKNIEISKRQNLQEIRNNISLITYPLVNRFLKRIWDTEENTVKSNLIKKLENLGINLKEPTNIIRNLSDHILTKTESELLNRGLDFCVFPTRLDIQSICAEF